VIQPNKAPQSSAFGSFVIRNWNTTVRFFRVMKLWVSESLGGRWGMLHEVKNKKCPEQDLNQEVNNI
jgi:hypothetical protein